MVLPIIGAVVGAGLGVAQSAAQTSAQNSAIRARNQAAADNYKAQLKIRDADYKYSQGIYQAKVGSYLSQLRENEIAATKAYASQQTRLNNLYKSYAFGLHDAQMKRAASQGQGVASGRSGRSIQRLDQMANKIFFNTRAKGLATLQSGQAAFDMSSRHIKHQLLIADTNAHSRVAIRPLPPRGLAEPVQAPGVNSAVAGLSMLSSGISGGLSGYNFGTGLDDYFNE